MSKSPASRKSNAAPHARAGAGKLQKAPELAEGELAEGRFLSLSKGGVAMKNGWQTKQLREVAEIFDGPHATPKTVDTGPVFLGISALQDGVINLGETRHVTEQDYKRWTRRVRPQPQDVVFSYETRLGQAAIIPGGLECCLGRRMGLVRFKGGAVVPQFFLYQYISPLFREFLDSKTIRGATVDRISIKDFPSFPIAFPPLSEQQRIVGILDAAFEGLATAKANAEKNLLNARALFDSHLQAVFSQRSLSGAEGRGKGWVDMTLESCCEHIFAGGDVPKDRLSPERTPKYSVPIFSNGEKRDGLYGYTDVARVTKPSITVSARGTLGFTAIRTEPFLPVVRLIVLVPDKKLIMLSFLYYALAGMDFGNTGTSIPQLTVPNFKEFKLHVPSLSAQNAIVTKLNALTEETQRLAAIYQRKLAALDALKKSLLHQAFTGEL